MNQKNIKHMNALIIKTKRLILRRFRLDDAQMMYDNWAHDAEVTKYLRWLPHENPEQTKAVIASWIDKGKKNINYYNCAITLKENDEVIGSITCFENAEIGYCLAKKYWNKSIMTEALSAVINVLFKYVGLESIFSLHMIDNLASAKVMKKCGLVFERQVTSINNQNEPVTCCLYRLENPFIK